MNINFTDKKLKDIKADLELIVVIDKDLEHKNVAKFKETLESAGFSGGQDEVMLLAESKKLFVGAESLRAKHIRPAVASALRSILGKSIKVLKCTLT